MRVRRGEGSGSNGQHISVPSPFIIGKKLPRLLLVKIPIPFLKDNLSTKQKLLETEHKQKHILAVFMTKRRKKYINLFLLITP